MLWMKTLMMMVRVMTVLLPSARTLLLSTTWTIHTYSTQLTTTKCTSNSLHPSKQPKYSKCSTCARPSSLTRRSTSSSSPSSPHQATLTPLSARITKRLRGYIRWRTRKERSRASLISGRMLSIGISHRVGQKLELAHLLSRMKWRLCNSWRASSCMNKFTTKHKYYPRMTI